MDIARQLAEKYPNLFDPLVNLYLGAEPASKEHRKLSKVIKQLLNESCHHAEMIQMRLDNQSLQAIGDQFNLTRERVRQIINKYDGYIANIDIGSKEWCLRLLNQLLQSQSDPKKLPSNEQLENLHSKLAGYLKEHFTTAQKYGKLNDKYRLELVKAFELDIEAEVKNHTFWSLERLIYEVQELARQTGKPDYMPMQMEMADYRRSDLRGAIQRFGGQSKVAELAGLKYQGQTVAPDGSRTYWTEERIRAFLYEVAEKEGHPGYMPTQVDCVKHSPKQNSSIISIFTRAFTPKEPTLSWLDVAQKYGLKYDSEHHRVTIAYVRSFVQSLGDALYNLTSAEIYVLFEQQGINKTGVNANRNRTFDNLVQAIQSGNLPREEVEKWANGGNSSITQALLDPENQTVEEAFSKVNKSLNKVDHKNKAENPVDEPYKEDLAQELPAPRVLDTLNSLAKITDILVSGSSDEEAVKFLVSKAIAKLWKRCFHEEEEALLEAKQHKGNIYSEAVRDAFIDEYTRCKQLPLPEGYSFVDLNGIRREPKLMQRLIAYRVLKDGRVLNLSGTGTGKTLSAVLASRVIGSQLTVIACPNATIDGWATTIRSAFQKSDIASKTWNPVWLTGNFPRYLLMNHEMFQNRFEGSIKRFINNSAIDFVVVDELHQVKQRDEDFETQRRRLINGLITDVPEDRPKPRVLGMSATPVINNLYEGKSLVELVSSLSHDDIGTATNIHNCMKLYQKFTTMGFRMMPQNEISRTPQIHPIDCTPYLEDLFALGHRPHPQQVEAILVRSRWSVIRQHLRAKTVIFTEYVKDIVPYLVQQIKQSGLSVGVYTGNDKYATEAGYKDMLEQFLKGNVEILVASIKCLGTGIDGLQFVSNNVIFATLPWTSTDYEQAIGRFDREGFVFSNLDIHIPKTYAILSDGNEWSWCESKLLRIENKRDIAKAAVDGEIPDNNNQLTPARATQYWLGWLRRLSEEGLNEIERKQIRVPLDESSDVEVSRRYASYGDFATLNSRWNNTHSGVTHERLSKNSEEWCYYHTRMNEFEVSWQVIPREQCIKHLKENLPLGSVIGDFGCGQAKLAEALREVHTVHSFDHVAINRSVVACDMANTPLDDATLDAAVFSLSLMGANIKDYITEAYRTLKPGGQLLIYHPAKHHDRLKFIAGLSHLGLAIVQHDEIYKWHYVWAIKQGRQENPSANVSF
jgi:superfamily II DNA or RNA helicase/SAM-dependent methyltransferase